MEEGEEPKLPALAAASLDAGGVRWSKLVIAGTVGGACAFFTAALVFGLLVCRRHLKIKRQERERLRRHRQLHGRSRSTSSSRTMDLPIPRPPADGFLPTTPPIWWRTCPGAVVNREPSELHRYSIGIALDRSFDEHINSNHPTRQRSGLFPGLEPASGFPALNPNRSRVYSPNCPAHAEATSLPSVTDRQHRRTTTSECSSGYHSNNMDSTRGNSNWPTLWDRDEEVRRKRNVVATDPLDFVQSLDFPLVELEQSVEDLPRCRLRRAEEPVSAFLPSNGSIEEATDDDDPIWIRRVPDHVDGVVRSKMVPDARSSDPHWERSVPNATTSNVETVWSSRSCASLPQGRDATAKPHSKTTRTPTKHLRNVTSRQSRAGMAAI